ncbi:interferon-induced transmembrane protein 1 [Nothobranchius furzeri]|uniref:Proline-rich transmembrane protein 1-like n=6 Tax=Nothobranchius TaxID=28779 RepID=A0A1A7ZD16_NOTFU|nr:proline-rich transmembrane protein 1 [Nothobranchius furzeri]KAF7226343.1 proline-rich transmembrane protein 1-like [Nothobranchius furzeri]
MDPNKPPSPSPMAWTEGKPYAGQYLPPPYNGADNPGPPPQPGPGYPPLPQYGAGYGQPQYPMGEPYSGQPGIITVQPVITVTQPLAIPVNDYLGFSIFTLLCCCLPLGIAALIYSISAREANSRGNRPAAERYSSTAKTLNLVALILGVLAIISSVVIIAVSLALY